MSGGILWQLVVSEVGFSEVFSGPTAAATTLGHGTYLPGPDGSIYCDDVLLLGEADVLCGFVYRETSEFS